MGFNGLTLGWDTSAQLACAKRCKEMQRVPISTSYFRFPCRLSPLSNV